MPARHCHFHRLAAFPRLFLHLLHVALLAAVSFLLHPREKPAAMKIRWPFIPPRSVRRTYRTFVRTSGCYGRSIRYSYRMGAGQSPARRSWMDGSSSGLLLKFNTKRNGIRRHRNAATAARTTRHYSAKPKMRHERARVRRSSQFLDGDVLISIRFGIQLHFVVISRTRS